MPSILTKADSSSQKHKQRPRLIAWLLFVAALLIAEYYLNDAWLKPHGEAQSASGVVAAEVAAKRVTSSLPAAGEVTASIAQSTHSSEVDLNALFSDSCHSVEIEVSVENFNSWLKARINDSRVRIEHEIEVQNWHIKDSNGAELRVRRALREASQSNDFTQSSGQRHSNNPYAIKFYSVDRERLPVPRVTPDEFKNLPADEIIARLESKKDVLYSDVQETYREREAGGQRTLRLKRINGLPEILELTSAYTIWRCLHKNTINTSLFCACRRSW
jgi:hypothetical protein